MTDITTDGSAVYVDAKRMELAGIIPSRGVTDDDAAMSRAAAGDPPMRHDVSSIPDDELLRRAVRNARDSGYGRRAHPRWVAVMHTFLLGSTFSAQLCRRFGLDPDEMVK